MRIYNFSNRLMIILQMLWNSLSRILYFFSIIKFIGNRIKPVERFYNVSWVSRAQKKKHWISSTKQHYKNVEKRERKSKLWKKSFNFKRKSLNYDTNIYSNRVIEFWNETSETTLRKDERKTRVKMCLSSK